MGVLLLLQLTPASAITRPELPSIHTRHATKARHVQHMGFSDSIPIEELRSRPPSRVDIVEHNVRSAKSKALVAAIAGKKFACHLVTAYNVTFALLRLTTGAFMALFVHFVSMVSLPD
jgi:hypothetical protein